MLIIKETSYSFSLFISMQIKGRKVKAVYLKDVDLLYVELLLGENDCPEKREFPDIQLCPGDCQGTYLSAVVKGSTIKIIGSIYTKPHIMYNEEFMKRHNLKKEELEDYIKDYLKNHSYTVISCMDGRKKRVYVGKEHVQTIFERCVFRVAQGEFANFLTKLREKELREIIQNIDRIKKIAIPATIGKLKQFLHAKTV